MAACCSSAFWLSLRISVAARTRFSEEIARLRSPGSLVCALSGAGAAASRRPRPMLATV